MMNEQKCVMVIDAELPLGLIANTAAVLGSALGKHHPELIGENVPDGNNCVHPGLIQIPIPILAGDRSLLSDLQGSVRTNYRDSLTMIVFSDVAQHSKNYADYTTRLSRTPHSDLAWLGICIYGNKKTVNHLTGSLPALK